MAVKIHVNSPELSYFGDEYMEANYDYQTTQVEKNEDLSYTVKN